MSTTLLPYLLKASGISGLALGMLFLVYRETIKHGLFPKLRQWQAFALLCLLLIVVLTVTITTIELRAGRQSSIAVATGV
jgi:hypothetical protein